MKQLLIILCAACAIGSLLGPGSARADLFDNLIDRVEQQMDEKGSREKRRPKVSLDSAANKVRQRYGGEIVRAETRYKDGRPVHRIKVLANGRMRTVEVDGMTGKIR